MEMVYLFINTILAFFKKDLLRVVRYPVQMFFEILLPIISVLPTLLLAYYMVNKNGIKYFYSHTGTNNYVLYLSTSIVFSIFMMVLEQTGYLIGDEMWMGTLEQIWLTPVKKIYFLLGWIANSLFRSIIYCSISMGVTILVFSKLGMRYEIYSIGMLCLAIFFLLVISVSLGLIVCSITLCIKQVDSFMFLVTGLLPIISGVAYPITVFPKAIQFVSKILPTTYAFDLVRYAFLKTNTIFCIKTEIVIISIYSLFLVIVSVKLFQIINRRISRWGTVYMM